MSFTYIPKREKWRTAMLLSWKKGDLQRFDNNVVRLIAEYAAPEWPKNPVRKLSVNLIGTYTKINEAYYEEKKKWTGNFAWTEGQELVLNGRYDLKKRIGQGAFGVVMHAIDLQTGESVAIKIIKARSAYTKQAQREIRLLQSLRSLDTENTSNVVELRGTFMYHQHQCLVFEMLSANLYTLLERVKFHGFSLPLVRKFANQLFVSLEFLARDDVRVIHTDIKPENICIRNSKRSAIKLIDFGSSCPEGQRLFSYIQSRYYRSPEVLLGLEYSVAIDTWSLACVLVEMHTGKPIFSGECQRDQLKKIMEVCGMPPDHMIDRSPESTRDKFFVRNEGMAMASDGSSQRWRLRHNDCSLHARSLVTVLGVHSGGPEGRWKNEEGHTSHHYEEFADLIGRMLILDPLQRISPTEALAHPFLAPLRSRALPASNLNAAAVSEASSGGGRGHVLRSTSQAEGAPRVRAGGGSSGGGRRVGSRSSGGGGSNSGTPTDTYPSQAPSRTHQSHSLLQSSSNGHVDSSGSSAMAIPSNATTNVSVAPHQDHHLHSTSRLSSTPSQQHSPGSPARGGDGRPHDPTAHMSQQHQAELSAALHAVGCPERRLLHYSQLNWETINEILRNYTAMNEVTLLQVRQLFVAFMGEKLRARRDKALQELLEMLRAHHPHTHSRSRRNHHGESVATRGGGAGGGRSGMTHGSVGSSVDELESVESSGLGTNPHDPMVVDNSTSPAP